MPDDYNKKYIFSIANNKFSVKNKDNILSIYYNTLGGNTEFEIENGTNWSEDIQFELQTSNWNDEKKFRIIMNGKIVIEKVSFFDCRLHKPTVPWTPQTKVQVLISN